jgi:hypothetical protein
MREQIESALLAASPRPGAPVPGLSRVVRQTMIGLGLLSAAGNLTQRGAQARRSLAEERERQAFGL